MTDWERKIRRLKLRQDPGSSEELAHRVNPAVARTATTRYLERVRDLLAAEQGLPRERISKYKIAQRLGIAPNRISHYYLHGGSMEPKLCYLVADLLGEDRATVFAEVAADVARREEDRAFWKRMAQRTAAIVGGVGVCILAVQIARSSGADPAQVLEGSALLAIAPEALCIMSTLVLAALAVYTAAGERLERALRALSQSLALIAASAARPG